MSGATDIKFDYAMGGGSPVKAHFGIVVNGTIYWDSQYDQGTLSKSSSFQTSSLVGKTYYKVTTEKLSGSSAGTYKLEASNLSDVTALIFKPTTHSDNHILYIDNITAVGATVATNTTPTTNTTTTPTTTTTTTPTTTRPTVTYAPVGTEAVEIVRASLDSSLKFDPSTKQLSIQGNIIPEWPQDESGNPEFSIKFKLIKNISVQVSDDNKMIKCVCTIEQEDENREFTYVYARRAG